MYDNIDVAYKHNVGQNMSNAEEYILFDSSYIVQKEANDI